MDFSEKRADKQGTLFQNELHFVKKMEEGTRHTGDGHYEMSLPFRSNTPKLPNNKSQALCRLKRLKTRMENDMKYRQDYMAFMQDIIEKGFLKGYHTNNDPTTMEGRGTSAITGENHQKNDKIKIVFLQCNLRGPFITQVPLSRSRPITNFLVGVLCRFRKDFTITTESSCAHWLIFIVNKRTDT